MDGKVPKELRLRSCAESLSANVFPGLSGDASACTSSRSEPTYFPKQYVPDRPRVHRERITIARYLVAPLPVICGP